MNNFPDMTEGQRQELIAHAEDVVGNLVKWTSCFSDDETWAAFTTRPNPPTPLTFIALCVRSCYV